MNKKSIFDRILKFYTLSIFFLIPTTLFCHPGWISTVDNDELSIKEWPRIEQQPQIRKRFVKTKEQQTKHFTILTCSYKNKDWYKNNLESVFNQKYSNYSLIYIDDCSPDNTADLVETYITLNKPACTIKLIKNKKRTTALLNLYRAIHMCNPEDIIITLDGDDWLAHENVLSKLNDIYQDENIWLTYGQFQVYPSKKRGFCAPYPQHIIDTQAYRSWSNQPSHLRSFYAWLAQQIKIEDMFYEGKFYQMTYDLALTMPMMEMASNRHKFIPDILYIYNEATPINDHKTIVGLQKKLADTIRAKERYQKVDAAIANWHNPTLDENVDTIIYSRNPKNLCALLNSLKMLTGIGSCIVLYATESQEITEEYNQLKEQFSENIQFFKSDLAAINSVNTLISILCQTQSKYALLIQDNISFTRPLNLNGCLCSLEQSKAYAFYLYPQKTIFHLNNNSPTEFASVNFGLNIFKNTEDNVIAWQLKYSSSLEGFHNSYATIYRKEDLMWTLFKNTQANDYLFALNNENIHLTNKVGLCYEHISCCTEQL